MTTAQIIQQTDEHILGTYGRFPVAFTRASGATLYDAEGKSYIDFASGIGVNSIGYANSAWTAAVAKQAETLQHVSNLYYTAPGAELAAKLTERSGLAAAFFANSGAEANEGLIKLARKYSYDTFGLQNRKVVLTLENSFHGRTLATLEATGQEKFHGPDFFPYTGAFRYVEPGSIDAVKDACASGDVCAVLIELIQGEGGVYPLPQSYVTTLAKFCAENNLLLLIDEVQTGIGRTGKLFAYQHYGLSPDAVSFAKGIGGGLPLGGFLVSERLRGVLTAGTHATTFGANPVCCAGANVVLDTLTDSVLAEVTRKGETVKAFVQNLNSAKLGAVRGIGLMLGIEVKAPLTHRELVTKLLANGLVALTAGSDTLRFLPPLTVSDAELHAGLEILAKTIQLQY
ncbi:MAG: acetylornithine/succinylornithine family transaminase [Oscillospiraceae bacterium]|jgi:acetylornithine/N-succinyldiaminopimelate aminotransferase|nr:acetylornithine/succinylornithine family transaminase [Oscillospiraceae bacterium]